MDRKYKGMTVNERLYVSGLMDEFEEAIESKNVEKARKILKAVELTDEAIKPVLAQFGL